jgi:hypothetical protein
MWRGNQVAGFPQGVSELTLMGNVVLVLHSELARDPLMLHKAEEGRPNLLCQRSDEPNFDCDDHCDVAAPFSGEPQTTRCSYARR